MSLVILRDLPRYESLLEAAREFPDLEASATEAFLHLLRTGDAVLRLVENNLARHQITQGRFGVLMALLANDRGGPHLSPLTPTTLAERTGVTPATMTGLIDTLESDGLVQRTQDPRDRRKTVVKLAPRASKLLAKILPGHFQLMAAVLLPLNHAERELLVSLLQRIATRTSVLAAPRGKTVATPTAP